MGKKRKKPYLEGSVGTIYKYFIKPMIALKPRNLHLNDWLDQVFCVEDRFIDRFTAKANFEMPGLIWAAPKRLFPGFGNRVINQGDEVWVRKDLTMPDKIDVETFNGQGAKSQIFSLSRREYDLISHKLTLTPFKERKPRRHSWDRP